MKTNLKLVTNESVKPKAKRIKKAFSSSSQVFHVWAQQSQDEGYQSGRIERSFFLGKSCYSYGAHYELGRFTEINGHTVVLINTSGYSTTTGKHINEALSAVRHLPLIRVDKSFDWVEGMLSEQDSIIDNLFDQLNGRSFWSETKALDGYGVERISNFNALCNLVGMPELKLFPDSETINLIQEHIDFRNARQKELDATKDARRAIELAKKAETNKLEIEAWINGGQLTSAVRNLYPQIIRIKNNSIETSGGAEVPYMEALKLAHAIENNKNVVGVQVGQFEVDEVTETLIKIGCHTFNRSITKQLTVGGK